MKEWCRSRGTRSSDHVNGLLAERILIGSRFQFIGKRPQ